MIDYIKDFNIFIVDTFKSRRTIIELAKKDFSVRYLGSCLGIIWAFIHPSIYILLMFFVFQIGFRVAPTENYPYILWLMAGMMPWMFFAESLASATTSVMDHSFLVKKIVFRVSVLPIVRILSALFIHLVFVTALAIVLMLYGYRPHIYYIQTVYYLFACIMLVLGLAWISSSLIIFLKDVGQIISVVLQFGFWVTPIFWSINLLPPEYHTLIKLNPVYYLVDGYRASFLYKQWFWENPWMTVYFWAVTFSIFVGGAVLFRRLRPHFADVL